MDNQDILKQIAHKLDDETLLALLLNLHLTSQQASSLLDNIFWHWRTEHLVGRELQERPNADWKAIYYGLSRPIASVRSDYAKEGLLRDEFQRGLASGLDVLLVQFEMYGKPIADVEQGRLLVRRVQDLSVLKYLIEQSYIEYNEDLAEIHIGYVVDHNKPDLAQFAVEHINIKQLWHDSVIDYLTRAGKNLEVFKILYLAFNLPEWYLVDVLINVAASGSRDTLSFLIEGYEFHKDQLVGAATEAVRTDSASNLELILGKYDFGKDVRASLLKEAVTSNSPDCALILYDRGRYLVSAREWREYLYRAIEEEYSRVIVKMALDNIIITDRDELELLVMASTRSASILNVVLSDERIDIESNIDQLLENVPYSELEGTAMTIAQHPRVNLDTISVSTSGMLFSVLRPLIRELLEQIGLEEKEARDVLEDGTDLYSSILRYILFKRPSKVQLMDWLIEKRDIHLSLVASNVLEDKLSNKPELVPIETLFLVLLRPKTSIDELQDNEMSSKLARAWLAVR
ncbi:Hypothetical protein POVR2_LOCUS79 [uncultured virus]|nr:Hypothetical protein POVR2_LOCUS79 [uncultured virus]